MATCDARFAAAAERPYAVAILVKHDVSLLVPSHNRRELLALTLSSVRELQIPDDAEIELIVVANACTDGTAAMVEAAAERMPIPTRCVVEARPGSSRARNRAAAEARGDLLAYIDDDVLLDPGWLRAHLEVFATRPADIVGGPIRLWWQDVERPPWFSRDLDAVLAMKDHGDQVIELRRYSDALTANLVCRRAVFERMGGFRLDLERRGTSMGSSEDIDFLRRALETGFRLFYAPAAAVQHWVDPRRISSRYLCGTAFGVGSARVFMIKRVRPRRLLRSVAGHVWLAVVSLALEWVAALRADRRTMMRHRIRKWTALGGLRGWCRRATRRANLSE